MYYKLDFIREKGEEIVSDTIVPAFQIYQGESYSGLVIIGSY